MPASLLFLGMDAKAHLENLRSELIRRDWSAEIRSGQKGPILHVKNLEAPRLNEDVACRGGSFWWETGGLIGPVTEVPAIADRIQHVLRGVGE